jgi:hypothetical protein
MRVMNAAMADVADAVAVKRSEDCAVPSIAVRDASLSGVGVLLKEW